jgi:bifunctional DNA-binding transcriptional regulator/antitoxin component of YhaV-PrlF toxin-antitoxin module
MATTYRTLIIPEGKHASFVIPDHVLAELGANKRAPLKITVNGYTYQSTATGVNGECRVVFPSRDREAAGVEGGDTVDVTLQLDDGYREVTVPDQLTAGLEAVGLSAVFHDLNYSTRKEYARQIADAKTNETIQRRTRKIIEILKTSR